MKPGRHDEAPPAKTAAEGALKASLTRRHVRMVLGGFWLLDAALQAQPHLFTADWWHGDLAQSVMGQPPAVARSMLWVVDEITIHPALWNGGFVVVQALLGLCLLAGRFEKAAIVASIPWALGVWWIGEGFGALTTGFGLFAAGAPGPVLYYPLIGLLAWPNTSRPDTGRGPAATAVWASLWVGGALALVPSRFGAGRMLQANLEEHALDQPGWLADAAHQVYRLVGAHPLLVPVLLAAAQAAVGLAVLLPRARRAALSAGILLAALFWIVFEGLGGVAAGGATDPGAAPLLVVLGLYLSRRKAAAAETPVLAHRGARSGTDRTPVVVAAQPE